MTSEKEIQASLHRHIMITLGVVGALVLGLGGWAALTSVSGAVIASGALQVETNTKEVQHQEGGIVSEILVRNGDMVQSGDLLVRLDDTVAGSGQDALRGQIDNLEAQAARLGAEVSEQGRIDFPPSLEERRNHEPRLDAIMAGHEELLAASQTALAGRRAQIGEQISQFEQEIEGLRAQQNAKAQEMELVGSDLTNFRGLLEKGIVTRTRVMEMERDAARLAGEHGEITAQIARASESISERNVQMIQIQEQEREQSLEELQNVQAELAQLLEQEVATLDRVARLQIRAPNSGYVHQLAVHTLGGVIAPRETIMEIVPEDDALIVEARIEPIDIDQVHPGQAAVVRLPGLDQRTTPELEAVVNILSADLSRDDVTGQTYYTAWLTIDAPILSRLGEIVLAPGMPVEAFIKTDERTVLSYLVKPISDQIAHAFRES